MKTTFAEYRSVENRLKAEAALDPTNRDRLLNAARAANHIAGMCDHLKLPLPTADELRTIADYVEQEGEDEDRTGSDE